MTDEPVVMGEFPSTGLTTSDYATLLDSRHANGYAGALGWAHSDSAYPWSVARDDVRAFSDQHVCETQY